MSAPDEDVPRAVWLRAACAFCDSPVRSGEALTWLQLYDVRNSGVTLKVHVVCLQRATNEAAWRQIEHLGLVTFSEDEAGDH